LIRAATLDASNPADLPLLLILAGVIGGLIGIFLGPTILAVSYTLLRS